MKLNIISEGPKDIEALNKRFTGWKLYLKTSGKFAKLSINNQRGGSLGDASLMRTSDGFWSVSDIEAFGKNYRSNKWGPLLYDVIIEFVTMSGNGLVPAETLTLIKKEFINYQDADMAPPGKPIGVDLGNFTSPHAKKVYKRLFETHKGLYGKPIEVEQISVEDAVDIIGPIFMPKHLKGTNIEGIPWNWREKPEWIELVKKEGGVIRDSGWPLFKSHSEAEVREHPYLFAIYRKQPFVIPKLQEHNLIEMNY